MLRKWAHIEKARSHSGRRDLATDVIHKQKKPLSVAQALLGHVQPSTTVTYTQPSEQELSEALIGLEKK